MTALNRLHFRRCAIRYDINRNSFSSRAILAP
jgi:hypothetical protein